MENLNNEFTSLFSGIEAQAAKVIREEEGDDLCQQKHNEQADLIQAECGSDGDCLIDDGVHTVDVEEECQQEK